MTHSEKKIDEDSSKDSTEISASDERSSRNLSTIIHGIVKFAPVAVLALALPITLFVMSQRIDPRQRASETESSPYKVKVFYFYPSDKPAPDSRRITTVQTMVQDVQQWYLVNVGKTFDLFKGYPIIVKGSKTASNYLNGSGVADEVIPPDSRDPSIDYLIIIQNDNNPDISLWHGGPFNGKLTYTKNTDNGMAIVDTQDALEPYLADPNNGGSGVCPNGVQYGKNGTDLNWTKSCKPPKAIGGVAHEMAHMFGLTHPGSCITETCENGKPGRDFLAQCIPQNGAETCDSRTVFFSGLRENSDYKIVIEHQKNGKLWVNDFICLTDACDASMSGKMIRVDYHRSAACNLYTVFGKGYECANTVLDSAGMGRACLQKFANICDTGMPGASFVNIKDSPYTPELDALKQSVWLWKTDPSNSTPSPSPTSVIPTPTGTSSKVSPCSPYGDVNKDGIVSTADSDLILQYLGSLTSLTDDQKRRGDVTNDGNTNAVDAQRIISYLSGAISTFPVCNSIASPFKKALKFNGYFLRTASFFSTLENTNDYTMEGWVKPEEVQKQGNILSLPPHGNTTPMTSAFFFKTVAVNPNDQSKGYYFILDLFDNDGVKKSINTSIISKTFPYGQWRHFVITMKKDNTVTLYVNGEAMGSTKLTTPFYKANKYLYLGGMYVNADANFKGSVDEIRFSNKLQYSGNFNVNTVKQPFPGVSNVTTPNVHALWHFDDSITDSTVNKNNFLPIGQVTYVESTVGK